MHKIHNYIAEVTKDSLKTDITNANYDACLNNGNADLSIIEQEVVYLLLLCEDTPTVKYFSVKSVKMADAAGIIESIETVFNRFGIMSFTDGMPGLNVDGASVNVGVHRGVDTQLMKKVLWLQVIHCFNHRAELVLKDVFTTIHFKNIKEMLLRL